MTGATQPEAGGAVAHLRHPCFEPSARHYGRIHLPVAPACNAQCNYCDRRQSCANESRPGLASTVMAPSAAAEAVRSALARGVPLSVVGIAGPGDALANPEATFETLRAIRREFPGLLLCVSTNGLALPDWVDHLESVGVSHLTITINAVLPQIAARVYRWVRVRGRVLRGGAAGEAIVAAQEAGLAEAVRRGFTTKVNSVVIPGVNQTHVAAVARRAAEIGADLHNCIPLIPVKGTPFAAVGEPTARQMAELRDECAQFIPQMTHCMRCRADACGRLGSAKSA